MNSPERNSAAPEASSEKTLSFTSQVMPGVVAGVFAGLSYFKVIKIGLHPFASDLKKRMLQTMIDMGKGMPLLFQ